MTVQAYYILTASEAATVMQFNTPQVAVKPRAVDSATPPAGLSGKFLAPARIVTDPEYQTYAPGMVAFLGDRPRQDIDSAAVFAPPVGPD